MTLEQVGRGMSQRWMIGIGLVFALGVSACGVPTNSPWMLPGQNCQSCHNPYGQAYKRPWSAGGTVFASSKEGSAGAQGVEVVVVDANDQTVTMVSNGVGNFFTGETLTPPFKSVAVGLNGKWVQMPMNLVPPGSVADGSCNRCHSANGQAGLVIYQPPQ